MDDKIKNKPGKPVTVRTDSGQTVNLTPGDTGRAKGKRPKKPIPLIEKPIRKPKDDKK